MKKENNPFWFLVFVLLIIALIYYFVRKNNIKNELEKRLKSEEEKLNIVLNKLNYNEERLNTIYQKIEKEVKIWRLIIISIYLIINLMLILVFKFDLSSILTWNTSIWLFFMLIIFAIKGKKEDINLINNILNKYIRRKYLKKISEHNTNIRKLSIDKHLHENEIKKINNKLNNLD